MRPNQFMPMYWGDYLRDTGHLSAAEHGGYLLLIGHYWTTGKPLPSNPEALRRIARLERSEWEASCDTILSFFTLDGECYRHARIEAELAKAVEKYERRANAGRKGNEKRWGGASQSASHCDPNADRNGIANTSQPQPQPHSSKEENLYTDVSKTPAPAKRSRSASTLPAEIEAEFAEWYAAYPLKKDPNKARAVYASVRKRGVSASDLLDGASRYASECLGRERRFIKHPTTWLNAGAWQNEAEQPLPFPGVPNHVERRPAQSNGFRALLRRELEAGFADAADGEL